MAKKQGKSEEVNAMLGFIRENGYDAAESEARADWREINPDLLLGAIYAANSKRAAILFGTDRNGFLFSITVYAGGEKATKYFHPERDIEVLEEYLRTLINFAENIA